MSINRRNIQPDALHVRRVDNRVLYSHVVSVEPKRLIFVSGQLSRDRHGNIVGKGDMGAQLRQALENIKAALEAAGARLEDLVRTNTYVTDIDEYFKHVEIRTAVLLACDADEHDGRGQKALSAGVDGRDRRHRRSGMKWGDGPRRCSA